MQRRIRVLVGKPGLDGHDRGAKVVAAALRDAGMEVIYTGLHQTSEQIVEAALQEDVDVIALSILSGAHMTQFPEVYELLRERGLGDRRVTGGGIIPPDDMETLARMGVGRLFGPGSSTQDIVEYIRAWYAEQHGAEALTPLPEPRPIAMPAPFATQSRPAATAGRGSAETSPRTAAPRKVGTRKTTTRKTVARKAAPRKAAPRKAATRKAAARKASPRKAATRKTATRKATPRKASPRKTATRKAASRRTATPKRASARTKASSARTPARARSRASGPGKKATRRR